MIFLLIRLSLITLNNMNLGKLLLAQVWDLITAQSNLGKSRFIASIFIHTHNTAAIRLLTELNLWHNRGLQLKYIKYIKMTKPTKMQILH